MSEEKKPIVTKELRLATEAVMTLTKTKTKARNMAAHSYYTFPVNNWEGLESLLSYLSPKGKDNLAADIATYVVNKYFRGISDNGFKDAEVALIHDWDSPGGQGRRANPEKKIGKMLEGKSKDEKKALLLSLLESLD